MVKTKRVQGFKAFNAIFLKVLCIFTALFIAVSSFVTCFASVVKVPVFTSLPQNVFLVAGNDGMIEASAKIFADDETEIEYSLEVLKHGRFYSTGDAAVGISGRNVQIDVSSGKGSSLLMNHGIYTARIKATPATNGEKTVASGYSPAFEIVILPPIIRGIKADSKVCYGDEFYLTADVNPYYGEGEKLSFIWTVDDGGSSRVLTDGETVNGVAFSGTTSGRLKIHGTVSEIFNLSFSVTSKIEGAKGETVSSEITVEFRPERIHGFSLGEKGMRFFRYDGDFVTGWLKHKGSVYYFDPESGIMETGSRVIDGKICVFGPDGRLSLGFYKTPLGWRYVENGIPVKGWHRVEGVESYFDPLSGYMTAKKNETN